MKHTAFIIAVSILLVMSSCGKKSEGLSSVEIIEGIECIHNTENPLYPDKTVSFEEELSIEQEDEDGNIILYRPFRYIVDKNENIYICDSQDMNIKVFDKDGNYFRTVGAKGSGPGEFQGVGEISLCPDGRLLVLDWELYRTSLFNADGNLLSSHKWRNWSYHVYLTTNSSYTKDENIFGEEEQLFIKTHDFSGKELISFGKFTHYQSQSINDGGRLFSVSLPFGVRSIVAGDQKNTWLYHCLNDKYVMEVYNQEGKLFRKIDRPYERISTVSDDKKRYLEGFSNVSETELALIDKYVKMPKFRTVTDRMIVDDLGHLWVETNEEKKIEGKEFTAYDIFNEDGFYEARVWLDIRPGLFCGGKMYRMPLDEETGYRSLKRYRIIWSE